MLSEPDLLKIQVAPSPVLSARSADCSLSDIDHIKVVAEDMASTMYATGGCGLAAPQVGMSSRLIVVDCQWNDSGRKEPVVLLNPEITTAEGDAEEDYEGCLSVPGVKILVARKPFVEVRYIGSDGEEHELAGEGLLARCLQHEIDHLDGITMLERVRGLRKLKAVSLYQAALKQGAVPGSDPLFTID